MLKQTLYKRILSYLYPVRIRKGSSTNNPVLELFLYRGQYQLATRDALYSDGIRYTPMVLAFNKLKRQLPGIQKMLVLGAGLGSAVQILNKKGFHPACTLVDNDDVVLRWLDDLMDKKDRINLVLTEAATFVDENTDVFDLVVIDIFKSRVVPDFVISPLFLQKCRKRIVPGGHLVMNYIVENAVSWNNVIENVESVFPDNMILIKGINRIVIAKV